MSEPTVEQLRDRATELGLEGVSKLNKAELTDKIAEAEEAQAAQAAAENAEFPPATEIDPPITPPEQAESEPTAPPVEYPDDTYSVDQLVASPALLDTEGEDRRLGGSTITVALKRADDERQLWTIADARDAVDVLLSRPVG